MASSAPIRRLAGLTYDVVTRRYRRANGRFLSTDDVLGVLEHELVAAKVRFRALGQELIDGKVNLAEFQIRLEGMAKRMQLIGASLRKGGFAQLSGGDLGFVGQRVRTQLAFVANLLREIERGKQRLDGTLLSRLDQYAAQGRMAERAMTVRIAKHDGHRERRRVLGAADACRDSHTKTGALLRHGCIEARRMGWNPIDSDRVPECGGCTCLGFCRCGWEFRGGRAA